MANVVPCQWVQDQKEEVALPWPPLRSGAHLVLGFCVEALLERGVFMLGYIWLTSLLGDGLRDRLLCCPPWPDGERKALESPAALLLLLPSVGLRVLKSWYYLQTYLELDARLVNGLPCGWAPTSVFLEHPSV